jgi:mannose-1-phosphate guanylyltransferase
VISVIGIEPTRPATGYGYIECGQALAPLKDSFEAKRFCEKPDLATAKQFVRSGRFVWNAGIFTWSVPTFDSAMRRFAPAYFEHFLNFNRGTWSAARVAQLYAAVPSISIDKLLAEKADSIAVVRSQMGWDDIGTWEALRRMKGDGRGNVFVSSVCPEQAKDCVVSLGEGTRAVVAGVEGLVIIRNGQDYLICSNEKAEEVRELKGLWMKHFGVKS